MLPIPVVLFYLCFVKNFYWTPPASLFFSQFVFWPYRRFVHPRARRLLISARLLCHWCDEFRSLFIHVIAEILSF